MLGLKTTCYVRSHDIIHCFIGGKKRRYYSRTIKMTSISKLGRPYENGKALDVSTRGLVITDLIDGMSAKTVGKKYKLGTKVVTKIKYRYEQDGTVFPTNRKFATGNPKKLDKNDIDFISHLKQVKPSISYNEIYNQVT